jgi:hypothetical protein
MHPNAWRTPYPSASTNRLSNSFGRIGPSARRPFILLPAAWRRPSAATRRPRRPTRGTTYAPRGATYGPCGATCGPCDLASGAARSPCGPPHSATRSPCDPAGCATCSSSARARGFSHFVTAAGHVDLPSLGFRTSLYSTVAHRYPALTIIGVWPPRRRPNRRGGDGVRAYVATARSFATSTCDGESGGGRLIHARFGTMIRSPRLRRRAHRPPRSRLGSFSMTSGYL